MQTRPLLVLRHEPFEHLGYFADILQAREIPFAYTDLGQPLPGHAEAPLIVMGGPQSANDPLPGLAAEIQLIQQTITRGIPVLGICLGAQLIAKALGARVYKNAQSEIGWAQVHFTEFAGDDPLFRGMPASAPFFHWHGETFDLPAGASWLAYSERCKNQAFCFKENVYGIQFHPEITPAMIEDWCTQPANCGDVAKFDLPMDPHAFDTAEQARQVLGGWLGFV